MHRQSDAGAARTTDRQGSHKWACPNGGTPDIDGEHIA